MEKKIFNPLDWLDQPTQPEVKVQQQLPVESNTDLTEIETIIQQIESKQIDITNAYSDWRDIGFAFADAFGEDGRDYFHRVSKFYADYSVNTCNQQFDKCLKANGQGITLKTFFFYAKQVLKLLPAVAQHQMQIICQHYPMKYFLNCLTLFKKL